MAITGSATPHHEKDLYETPRDLVARLDRDYGPLDLDAAANDHNAKRPVWLGPGGAAPDALLVEWHRYGRIAFCNPPYSRPLLTKFVYHAARQVEIGLARAVLVLPATTEVDWFQLSVWDHERCAFRPGVSVEFLPRRVHFVRPDGTIAKDPPGATMIVVFDAP